MQFTHCAFIPPKIPTYRMLNWYPWSKSYVPILALITRKENWTWTISWFHPAVEPFALPGKSTYKNSSPGEFSGDILLRGCFLWCAPQKWAVKWCKPANNKVSLCLCDTIWCVTCMMLQYFVDTRSPVCATYSRRGVCETVRVMNNAVHQQAVILYDVIYAFFLFEAVTNTDVMEWWRLKVIRKNSKRQYGWWGLAWAWRRALLAVNSGTNYAISSGVRM